MKQMYALILTDGEFRWLRAWLNAGLSPEPESARLHAKVEQLAAADTPKPQRVFP